ncbi:MAG: hypothetical protein KatS3mg003_1897 [Candidatus Nitrosocaldaceae archaeon]|nr:MAG: hypothetical protein KatS3mg003_1897 [Candidatus Nitrosocaldaceae archaeon]
MPRKGWKTVLMREEVYERFRENYEQHKPKIKKTFTGWLNEYLIEVIEGRAEIMRKAPALEFVGIMSDGSIAIKDHFEDKLIEVEPHGDKRLLYCRYCEKDDCLHVGFCFAIREVNNELVKRGFKLPRDIA